MKRGKIYEMNAYLDSYWDDEIYKAHWRNLQNLKESNISMDEDEEDIASIGDEFGLTEDEKSVFE